MAEHLHARWIVGRAGFGTSLIRALGWSMTLPVLVGVLSALAAPVTAWLLEVVITGGSGNPGVGSPVLIAGLCAAVLAQRGAEWTSTVLLRRRCELAGSAIARTLARRAIETAHLDESFSTNLIVARYPEVLAQYVFAAVLPGNALAVAALIAVSVATVGVAATAAVLGGISVVALAGCLIEAREARDGFHVERGEASRSRLMAGVLADRPSLIRQCLNAQVLIAFRRTRGAQVRALRRHSITAAVAAAMRDNVAVLALLAALGGLALAGALADLGPALALLVLVRMLGAEVATAISVVSCVLDARPVLRALDSRWLDASPSPDVGPSGPGRDAMPRGGRIAVLGAAGSGKTRLLADWATAPGPQTSLLIDRSRPSTPGTVYSTVTLTPVDDTHDDTTVAASRYVEALTAAGLACWSADRPQAESLRRVGVDDGLSDGERARLHLAQARYWQPDVLLLDDAFAALDDTTAGGVARAILGHDGWPRTVVFTTGRPELLAWADHALILTGETARMIPASRVVATDLHPIATAGDAERMARFLRSEPEDRPGRADPPGPRPEPVPAHHAPVPGAEAAAVGTDAADLTHSAPTAAIWFRHALGLYGPATTAVVATCGLTAIAATISAAQLSDTDDPRTVLSALTATILLGLVATFVVYALAGTRAVARMTDLQHLVLTRLLRHGTAAPPLARLTTDIHLTEFRASERLVANALGAGSAAVVLVLATITAPAILWALLPALVLIVLVVRGARGWRTRAQTLAVAAREPLLGYAEAALAIGPTFRHPGARAALDTCLGRLSDTAFQAGRRSLDIRAVLLAGTEIIAVALFAAVTTAVLDGDAAGSVGLSSVTMIYLAYTVTTELGATVERLQQADSLHATLTRVASLSGDTALTVGPRAGHDADAPTTAWLTSHATTVAGPAHHGSFLFASDPPLRLGRSRTTVLTGPSGSGKSTLLRRAATLPPRAGRPLTVALLDVDVPALRLCVADFLDPGGRHGPRDCERAWRAVHPGGRPLPALTERLDRLPHSERQLANLARVRLDVPDVLLLDEALSALDEADERRLLTMLSDHLPATTAVLAVQHRRTNRDRFDHEIRTIDRLDPPAHTRGDHR